MILQKARLLLQKSKLQKANPPSDMIEPPPAAKHPEAQLDMYTQGMYANNPLKAKDALDWQQRFPQHQVIGMAGHMPIFLTGGADISHGESGLHGGYTQPQQHDLAVREINHRLEHIQQHHKNQFAQNPNHNVDDNTRDEIEMLQDQKEAHRNMSNKLSGKS